ncbi:MAG: hypothetical protein O9301_00350 [Leptospira sp.]|nr:hypothetical protein [Leptospira sp.]
MDSNWLQSTLDRFRNEEGPVRKFLKEVSIFADAFSNQEFEKTDQLVRKEIGNVLSSFKEHFNKLESNFIQKAQIQNIGKTNMATNLLDTIINKVNSSGYGLNGLGAGFKATKEELESVLKHDFDILSKLGEIQKTLEEQLPSKFSENPDAAIEYINSIFKEFEKQFEERNSVFSKSKSQNTNS